MAYNSKQRAEALVVLEANGGNLRKTARELHIGGATIAAWRNENRAGKSASEASEAPKVSSLALETAEIIPAMRGVFIEDLISLRDRVLAHLYENLSELKAREAAITLGILIDKVELLEGNATSRTALVNGGSIDEAIERLTLELNQRAERTYGASLLEVVAPEDGASEGEPTTPE